MAVPRKVRGQLRISDHYQPHAQQIKFHECPAIYRLYGGAKGGGKSLALLWEAIQWCLRVPGCNVLLLRRTYPELKKGLIRHFELYVPPDFYGGRRNYNASEHTVTFPNGSKLFFGSCQHEDDVRAYQGQEFVFIGIDEAVEWSYYMFEFLTIQNRCPIKLDVHGKAVVPCMALATNPSGVGHTWIKALFIGEMDDNGVYQRTVKNVRNKIPELKNADIDLSKYEFIPAKIYDNPAYKNDKVYLDKLKSMNDTQRAIFLEGSWEAFEGQYFEKFDLALTQVDGGYADHLVKTQFWEPKWIGIDWGYAHWTAVYWYTMVSVTEEGRTRTVPMVYRELVAQEMGQEDLAHEIVKLSTYQDKNGRMATENIDAIFLSPDAFHKRGSQNTVAEQIGDYFTANNWPAPTEADDDRVGGARLIDGLLSQRPDTGLLISENCPLLLESIPLLMRSDKNIEDVRKVDGQRSDDIYDAFRYGLKSKLAPKEVPYAVQRQRILDACGSNQERFFTDMMMQAKRRQGIGIRIQRRRY